MIDHLCAACRDHFDRVRALLAAADLQPRLAPYMVRGLDYYCRTAFEVIAGGLGSQNALGGGGRYDGLVKGLGGPDVAGVGFALGIERLVIVLDGDTAQQPPAPEFVIAPLGLAAEAPAARLAHHLRRTGTRVEVEPCERSLKSQMRHAGKLGARYVILLGEDELAAGRVSVRDMTARRDLPRIAPLDTDAAGLREALAAASLAAPSAAMERHA